MQEQPNLGHLNMLQGVVSYLVSSLKDVSRLALRSHWEGKKLNHMNVKSKAAAAAAYCCCCIKFL